MVFNLGIELYKVCIKEGTGLTNENMTQCCCLLMPMPHGYTQMAFFSPKTTMKATLHAEHPLVRGTKGYLGHMTNMAAGGFPRVLRFPPPRMTIERQHPRLRERVYKFFELSV